MGEVADFLLSAMERSLALEGLTAAALVDVKEHIYRQRAGTPLPVFAWETTDAVVMLVSMALEYLNADPEPLMFLHEDDARYIVDVENEKALENLTRTLIRKVLQKLPLDARRWLISE